MKLPVGDTITETFAFLWRERRYFFQLATVPVVLLAIAGALLVRLAPTYAPGLLEGLPENQVMNVLGPGAAVIIFVAIVIYIMIYVLFAVAWHRRYLLPAEPATIGAAYRWKMRHLRFLWASIKIMLCVVPFAIIGIFFVFVPFLGPVLLVILGVILYVLAMRLSMWLPGEALDRSMPLNAVLAMTKGNGLRLFVVYIAVSIMAGIIVTGISLGMNRAIVAAGLDVSLTVTLITTLIDQFLTFFSIAVGVSVLSVAYKFLSAAQPAALDPE